MDPVLGPYGHETARYTDPYSLQHTGTYNRALSIEPEWLYVDESAETELNLNFSKNEFLEECTITDNYINISNTRFNMSSSENGNGKYHTLNTKLWILIKTDEKTDERGRVHLNREYIGKEPSVFVADDYQEPETCKYYVILSKSKWLEVRKIRGKEAGGPLEIQTNGDIWTGHKNKFVKVFVRK
jgi:hypothetical protein